MKAIELKNRRVSIYKNVRELVGVVSLNDVLHCRSQYTRQLIDHIRTNFEYKSKGYDDFKNQYMPAWITGGVVNKSRHCDEDIIEYSDIMVVDIDKKDNVNVDLETLKYDIFNMSWCLCVMHSVSNMGLMVVVPIEDHNKIKDYYSYMIGLFKQKWNINIDPACSNLARLRFMSYDENILIKDNDEDVDVWHITSIPIVRTEIKHIQTRLFTDSLIDDDDFCYKAADMAINEFGMTTNTSNNMKDWLGHISTLTALGQRGLQLALDLSRQSPKFKGDSEVISTFNRYCRRSSDRSYFTRYFKVCKEHLGNDWINKIKNNITT